jgi:hypothetical protein
MSCLELGRYRGLIILIWVILITSEVVRSVQVVVESECGEHDPGHPQTKVGIYRAAANGTCQGPLERLDGNISYIIDCNSENKTRTLFTGPDCLSKQVLSSDILDGECRGGKSYVCADIPSKELVLVRLHKRGITCSMSNTSFEADLGIHLNDCAGIDLSAVDKFVEHNRTHVANLRYKTFEACDLDQAGTRGNTSKFLFSFFKLNVCGPTIFGDDSIVLFSNASNNLAPSRFVFGMLSLLTVLLSVV